MRCDVVTMRCVRLDLLAEGSTQESKRERESCGMESGLLRPALGDVNVVLTLARHALLVPFVTLRCMALRCVAFRCVAFRCVALRCV